MWCSERRAVLAALAALAVLPACGFTPAYGPGGSAGRLTGEVALTAPEDQAGYLFNRRIEERLDRAALGRYTLEATVETEQTDLGTTSTGSTTRYRILGSARYRLTETGTGRLLLEDRIESFTGYSATGSNVSTLASERDALQRVTTILADRVVDALILAAPTLPE
ncbi:LPS assembly lipoprotein LptE [Roseivivax isoporae]|uniref:Lipoprotein n=1 Tax=Roseivivax isoporae LMG 25204 TaxID=1449351 RepID=X7FD42_9RHOB|nr:LPS assembly lipoprotein LptE [Roseivivax isoporae]ETX29996.1 hypothetical protein RISW2_20345 [Roseivivax isoporae LMG 25204]